MFAHRFGFNPIIIFELGKVRIAQLVTLSTTTGYILAANRLTFHMFIPVIGIFLMALGSGALNQYQERHADGIMPRTRNRPIPSGRISPHLALSISIGLICFGAVFIWFGCNPTAFFLAVLTVIWYNGIYTTLKKITPFAVIPGSVIGSLPPLVGWSSTGNTIFTPPALALAVFFFIWQIPHFWLLLLNFGPDYEKAGYPSLASILDRLQLGRLTFSWIVATAAAILIMPLFGLGTSMIIYLFLLVSSIFLVWRSSSLLRLSSSDDSFRMAFKGINIFMLSVMFLLTLDSLISMG